MYARSGGPGTMSAATASRAGGDGAASWGGDDGASSVCDHRGCDPSGAHDAARACCTHCSANCCGTPARCRPGPGRSPIGTCYSSDGAPGRRTTCSRLVIEKEL